MFLSPILTIAPLHNARLNGFFGALQWYQFKTLSVESGIIQLQFFEYWIILLFIISLAQKPVRSLQDKNLAWLLGLCALSISLHPKTIVMFVPIFLGFLLYYLVVNYTKNIKKLLYVIIAISFLNTIFAVLQFFHIDLIYKTFNRIDGLMCISSHLGAYQAIALPICYIVNPFLSIIPLIGLLLSKSYTPLLAGIIGMVYLFFPNRKKILINLAPIGWIASFGIISVFILKNYQSILYKLGLRLELWFGVLKDILKHPFIGSGFDAFSKVTSMGQWKVVFNEYLGVALNLGLIGLFFFGKFLHEKFKGTAVGIERGLKASCLISAIICLGQSSLHFPRLAGTIIVLFALWAIVNKQENINYVS